MSSSSSVILSDSPSPTHPSPPQSLQRVQPSNKPRGELYVIYNSDQAKEWSDWFQLTKWQLDNTKTIEWSPEKKRSETWKYVKPCARVQDGLPAIHCRRCGDVLAHPSLKNTGTSTIVHHLKTSRCSKEASRQGNKDIQVIFQKVSVS